MKAGSKYYALFTHLKNTDQDEIVLTFREIASLIGDVLPASARQRGWWSNRSQGGVQAAAWMEAGFHVIAVDFAAERVSFARPTLTYPAERVGDTVYWNGELVKGLRRHLALTQGELAKELGVRQQTISEWERGIYAPSRATSKYLSLVAERTGFEYAVDKRTDE